MGNIARKVLDQLMTVIGGFAGIPATASASKKDDFHSRTTSAAILAISAFGQAGQVAQQNSGAKSLAYDVVSVRQNVSRGSMKMDETADGLSSNNVTVWALIFFAYPDIKTGDQIEGMPAWTRAAFFNMEAKMDEGTVRALATLPEEERAKQRQLMLQAVLVDRFKMKIHHESRDRKTFALEIAPGGPKLRESRPDEEPSPVAMRNGRIALRAQTLDALTKVLTHVPDVDRVVVDETGLKGRYDITLTWAPDSQQNEADSDLSFFTALKEQLGLKLIPSKSSVDTIVVDHLEMPSEN